MNTSKMVQTVSGFLNEGTTSRAGRYSIVDHGETENFYFQFFVCGDENDIADGAIQANIVGLEHVGNASLDAQDRFNNLLKVGWHLEGGNAQRIFENCIGVKSVTAVVTDTMNHLLSIYKLNAQAEWRVQLELNE
jgi:hypothetical protein